MAVDWVNGDLEENNPVAMVFCPNCGWIKEINAEFIDIEEDPKNGDILTFACCYCGVKNKSKRYL